ncbi:hypothetical protein [Actinopolyspora erythraea]|nr:hypothetical protein [Actinopolyspora erythraea]
MLSRGAVRARLIIGVSAAPTTGTIPFVVSGRATEGPGPGQR